MVQRRRLRLLLTDRDGTGRDGADQDGADQDGTGRDGTSQDGTSILTARRESSDVRLELPALDVDLRERETTSAAAWRILPTIGLAGPVLDCYVDQTGDPADEDGEIVGALVELRGVPAGWTPPPGWAWTPLASADLAGSRPGVEPGLQVALADRLAELRGERTVPDLRVPWARPGWYEQATAWITRMLHEAGHPGPTAVIQLRHWGISAVMRVDTAEGPLWFKASSGPFRHEAAITAALHRAVPGRVTAVLAVDEDRGWLLLENIDGTVVGEDRAPTRAAFERLLDIQLGLAGREDDLRAAGCPHRPLRALPESFARTLATPLMRATLELSSTRTAQLIATLTEAVAAVEAIGVPESFVHGDFHPGNAISTADGIRIFDWSDAAVSNPLIDIATWASWFDDDPDHVDAIYRIFHEVRAAKLGEDGLARLDRSVLAAVAGAYHTISYANILEAMEPHRRAEHAGGIAEFFTLLDSATPR